MPEVKHPIAGLVRSIRSYVGANTALLVSGGIGAGVFVALLLASGEVYGAVAQSDGVSGLDQPVLEYAESLRTPTAAVWVTNFTNLGDTGPMVVFGLLITGFMYLVWRRRSILTLMVVAAAGSTIFTAVGKTIVGRNRPPLDDAVPPYEYAPSFPSGHTLNSTVIAAMLAYLTVWLAKHLWLRVVSPILATLWAGAMGLSRIYLGHHWLTDVIFGWLFGLAWVALIVTIHHILLRLQARRHKAAAGDDSPRLQPRPGGRVSSPGIDR